MYVLAIDQGTTGTTTILYDAAGRPVARAYREIQQFYPKPGWVEHDPNDIWASVCATVSEVLNQAKGPIVAIGITNQRETTLLWDRITGEPLHRAIVWQCRRTGDACAALASQAEFVKRKTGLPIDPYFSATKMRWLFDNVPHAAGDRVFGTVDSWLIWKLTGGRVHATDVTNASRTLLFDIHSRQWDDELCRLFGVPKDMLPEVRVSNGDFGRVETIPGLNGVPIRGVVGDQQAALFGQLCVEPGAVKNTYGTGCFLMMNTGDQAIASSHGLLTTLALNANVESCYAIEGAVFIGGAAVQWLRDELAIIKSAQETEAMAAALRDNSGVYLVPAFVGLGAPYWDADARGVLCGLTRGTGRNHIARAALESMAYQTWDVLHAMTHDAGMPIHRVMVDGGACANNFLLQFQADIAHVDVVRPAWIESTSRGAAYVAGLAVGCWDSLAILCSMQTPDREFKPNMSADLRHKYLRGWQHAVAKTRLK